MLFHAIIYWPSHMSTNLWHFAIKHAIDFHDAVPNNSSLSPLEIFTGLKRSFDFTKFHSFGSLSHVLEPSSKAGNEIPRWKSRSKIAMCLGKSSE